MNDQPPTRPAAPAPSATGRRAVSGRLARRRSRVGALATAVGLGILAQGCSTGHSIVDPHTVEADRTAALTWFMFALAGLISLVVFVLLLVGLFTRGSGVEEPHWWRRFVIGGGIVLPAVVLATLSGLTVWALATDPGADPGDVHVTVIGHQYWWEVRYPGTDAVTANEIHVPVGRTIRFDLEATDVIHSFWAPSLGGKVDTIPGRTNHLSMTIDTPGTYRGQCAEYCGVQHANMAFDVVAESEDDFRAWLADQATDATAPDTGLARQGRDVFEHQACAGCHTIRGTDATATVGPDLTHVGSRRTIAALTLHNDPDRLRGWIGNAQAIKPGSKMPQLDLSEDQLDAVVAYLDQLE